MLTFLDDEDALDEMTVTTIPEPDDETRVVQLRNSIGLVADEIRHKRPETIYAASERTPFRGTRAQLHYEFYRISDDNPARCVLDARGERTLEVVNILPAGELSGSHSTLIGG